MKNDRSIYGNTEYDYLSSASSVVFLFAVIHIYQFIYYTVLQGGRTGQLAQYKVNAIQCKE